MRRNLCSASKAAHSEHMRVLLLEDEPALRQLLTDGLGRHGMDVTETSTIADAFTAMRTNDFDVALVDLTLPDGSGLAVIPVAHDADAPTPVIIMSGLDTVADRAQAFTMGADDYIGKPFLIRELVARVLAADRKNLALR